MKRGWHWSAFRQRERGEEGLEEEEELTTGERERDRETERGEREGGERGKEKKRSVGVVFAFWSCDLISICVSRR